MKRCGKAFVLGVCLLFGVAAQAQDKPAEPVPVATASKAIPTEPTIDVVMETKIIEARALSDPENKFRVMRTLRIDLTRAVEEVRVQRVTLQDEITRQQASRKSLSEEKTALAPISGVSKEQVEFDLSSAKDEVKRLEDELKTSTDATSRSTLKADLEKARSRQVSIESFQKNLQAQEEATERQAKERAVALASLDRRIEQLKADEGTASKIQNKLATSQSVLDDEIGGLLKTESQRNTFKTQIALAFTGLVMLVIVGFFSVAFQDVLVRRSIFSSESGIQFLTLFSVVIAIILFGITGILESKELAALLGGLSGYILGRVTTAPRPAAANGNPGPNPNPNPSPNPNPNPNPQPNG